MKSKTYQRKSCEGHIYITIIRDKNDKFNQVLIASPSKNNDCGGSYAYAMQDLLTYCLRRAEDKKDFDLIIKAISHQICNAMPPNKQHCKSCSDCVASVIKEDFIEVSPKVL